MVPHKKCQIEKCENVLRVDNGTGFCGKHIRYGSNCKKCDRLIYRGRTYCSKCSRLARSFNSRIVVPCQYEGCHVIVNSKSRLCRKHYYSYHQCESPGCKSKVCFFSKYRLCSEHRNITRKLKRMGIPEYPIKPPPIRRKQILRKRIIEPREK